MRRQASLCGYAFRMVSGLALYSIVLMLLLPSAIGYHHFRGGSTSVEILDYSNPDFYKVRLTLVSGWELGQGPCGPNCSVSDIGRSTYVTRAESINRTGNSEYFGKWSLESKYPDNSVGVSDITDHVNKNIRGRVNNVNVPTKWMQEIAQFEVNINSSDYTDIILDGDGWMDTQLQTCKPDPVTGTCKYHLQQKMRLGIRDDTNRPNESPLVLFKPVYRVRLNEVTRIPITVADNDGDACRCRSAQFVELSLIHAIIGTNITDDCVVVIGAFESDGFSDGDWGIVNLIVEDVPLNTITMGGNIYQGKKENVGQTQVQFLIQTLANLTNPEFVAPTPCVNGTEAHVPSYYMYSGTTLRLPLHAQASLENFVDVEIERFHLTSMPVQSLSLPPPIPAPGRSPRDKVWMSQLNWKIDVDHSAHYLLQAIAVDNRGYDSNDCSFDVQVEVVNYTKQPSPANSGPYFPYFPDPGAIVCQPLATCALPIYAKTDDPNAAIVNISITSSDFDNPSAVWVGLSTFQNESVYQADISISSPDQGDKQLCVQATDSNGLQETKCLQITMFVSDPCTIQLDVCGKYGICHVNSTDPTTFYCECAIGSGGQFCEKAINPCNYDYCIRGAQCYYDAVLLPVPMCVCAQGGPQCIRSKYCKPHPCGDHGDCFPLPATQSHQCVCDAGYTGSSCQTEIACVNGGKMFYTGSVPACHCPLGFSGVFCAVDDPDPLLLQPKFADLLSPPDGATINCEVSQPCDFPVYTQGPSTSMAPPNITEGPKSPDIIVLVGPSIPSNATSLPGQVFGTPITTLSQTPGTKQLCLWLNRDNNNATSRCFNVVFQEPSDGPTASTVTQPHFVPPTLPANSTLPCSDVSGCHSVVVTTPDPSGQCANVSSPLASVIVFDPSPTTDGNCSTEVMVIPDPTTPTFVCLTAGSGATLCFNVVYNVTDSCQSVDCNQANRQGACLDGQCVCSPHFKGAKCQVRDECNPNPCHNGGICQASGGIFRCFCPLGHGGNLCATDDVDPKPNQPIVTDQLIPASGTTIKCKVNIPCDFPVYITGDHNGTIPSLTAGPKSPEINVTLDPTATVRDNSTGLPGFTFLTPVTTTSAVPGQKELCLSVGNQGSTTTASACYRIDFTSASGVSTTPPGSGSSVSQPTTLPSQTADKVTFLSPTPPGGTTLPCADAKNGCHLLVYYTPDNSTGDCHKVSSASPNVHVFQGHTSLSDPCITEVLILPKDSISQVCLQAGFGETRCFNVPLVNVSGPDLCHNSSCNHPNGACLPDPVMGITQCVCNTYFYQPGCLPDVCRPNPCENGGVCKPVQGSFQCFCPVGFSGFNCSMTDADPHLSKPKVVDQLGPTPGGTISCEVNIPCPFPVYTSGDSNGTLPQMSPGPLSPGLNVTIDQTVPENSTGLPGFTFITPVTTTSSVPGQKQLCLNIHNQNGVTDSACFHVIFTNNNPRPSNPTGQINDKAKFISPTPPDNTSLPCADSINGCNFLVYSEPGNASGACSQVTAMNPGVIIFADKGGTQCVNEVLVLPQLAPQLICLQAGAGEKRCFDVPEVNISGPALCQPVSCNSPHGACLADPARGTTQCLCKDHFILPSCLPEPCYPNPCQNGGICQPNNGTYTCFCRLGFSGGTCSMDAVDQHPANPSVTDQLGPTPGGTLNCKVNIPCHFPVYTSGKHNGVSPQVTPGPTSPGINVILDPTEADNSTGLPGFTYLTPVTTVSPVPGQKQLCLNIGNQQIVTDSACFHIIFTDNNASSIVPSPNTVGTSGQTNDTAKFVSSTPPNGTILPCSDSTNGCHFLVYSDPGNSTGDCPQIAALTPGVLVFKSMPGQGGGQCVNEVLVLPQVAPQLVCLQAGLGETRCLKSSLVNASGPTLCQNVSCNSPHGACLADPSLGTTQCVCNNHFSLPACAPDPCNPNPCQNGGICRPHNGTYTCFCRLGFSRGICAIAAVDQHPQNPSTTDKLGPTPGGTINCMVNIPCNFPVYTAGNSNGTYPKVTPGPTSPGINVILDPTKADNSTGLPGFTYLTPVTTVSPVPGQKQLCVNIGNQQTVIDSACFHINFANNGTTSATPLTNTIVNPVQSNDTAKFVSPTPPDGTTLPCSDSINGCHFLVYSKPGNVTGDCPQVAALTPGVMVFQSNPSQGGDQCVNEVLVLPNVAPQLICIQAGVGEARCFSVPMVNASGPVLCQNTSCNSPHGACLASPSLGTTVCVCHDHASPPRCAPDPCSSNPCQNGGLCQSTNSTFDCICPLGFSGLSCSKVDAIPVPVEPSITDQLSPTPGGTIKCKVDVQCYFPVYVTTSVSGNLPQVTKGPSSPDINMTLDPTETDNSTGLPGFTFLTPVTVVSSVPGQKKLCVNIGKNMVVTDSGCFHVIFTDDGSKTPSSSTTASPGQITAKAKFVSPTPPDGTSLPCSNPMNGCHFLVYSEPGNATGDCPKVTTTEQGVYVFPNSQNHGVSQCVNEVLVMPQLAPQDICLKAGCGENRCFNMPPVNVSGPALCENKSCHSPNGACLADPGLGTTECVCEDPFIQPSCLPVSDPCIPDPCHNGGICQANNGTFICLCRLGFSGLNCSDVAVDTSPMQPSVTDQLGPTPGGTISCMVNTPCHFPVYTAGDHNGALPNVYPGPKSPEINVTLAPTVADNTTGLPGFTFLTPVSTTSSVPGHKQLCLDISNHQGVTNYACFNLIFTDNATSSSASTPPNQGQPLDKAKFVSPTPPDGSKLPCSDSVNGCHFLVYSEPSNATSPCPQVSATQAGVHVFPGQGGGQCVNEILVLPQKAPQLICLQAGQGEMRCFNVPLVNASGSTLCQNHTCHSPHGACLAKPDLGTTQCVCQDNYPQPNCQPGPCEPNPCKYGGICHSYNGTYKCFCRLGFSGIDCSSADVDLHPSQPSVTDQLGPTPGGTVSCLVNIPCHFPVYTIGNQNGDSPVVTTGPSSPDISVTVDTTVADNSTGLPGFTYLSPVTTVSPVPGQKQLCVNIGDHQSIKDSACFHVLFIDNATTTALPNSPNGRANGLNGKFVLPTPPSGTTLPCSYSVSGCHFLVYSSPDNTTGTCSKVLNLTQGVVVFPSSVDQGGGQCVNEVLVLPQEAPQDICLQAGDGAGETRCFNVTSVQVSGPDLCRSAACNSPHGACLADPDLGTTQCVCEANFLRPNCLPTKCQPNTCQNDGICSQNLTRQCLCPLGFSGTKCSTVDVDPQLPKPQVTNQIGPTAGSSISCFVDIPCHFPIYTSGNSSGSTPWVTPGPKSHDINVTLDPTVGHNFTGLPGFTFLTPAMTVSSVPGLKQLCVIVGDDQGFTDDVCFNVKFKDNVTTTPSATGSSLGVPTLPANVKDLAQFIPPTPPGESVFPCSDTLNGCHILVFSSPDNTSGNCPQVSALDVGVYVFPNRSDQCVNEIVILPLMAPERICVQTGLGEIRCFIVPDGGGGGNITGPDFCKRVSCNRPYGACLPDLIGGTVQCVCQDGFSLPRCLPESTTTFSTEMSTVVSTSTDSSTTTSDSFTTGGPSLTEDSSTLTTDSTTSTEDSSTSTTDGPTSTEDSSTSTTDGSTSTEDSSTSTTDSTTSTEESSTSTTYGPTSTEDSSTSTTDGPTSTEDSSTSTTGGPTSTEDSSTSTTDSTTSTEDSSTSTTDGPTSTEDSSTSTTDGPTSTEDSSTLATDGLTSTEDSSTSTTDGPTSTEDSSTSTTDGPTSTEDSLTATTDGPTSTVDISVSTTYSPTSTLLGSASVLADSFTSTTDASTSTADTTAPTTFSLTTKVDSPTSTMETSASTTVDISASTTDASTSTVDRATSTIDASTSTVDSATSTVEASTSTVDSATSTIDASTSTVDSATSTVEASTSTVDSATSTIDASTSTVDSATSTIDASTSTVDSALSTVDASTSTVDSATSTVDASTSTIDTATSTVEASTSTVDSATSTVEASTSTVDSAISTVEASTSTVDSATSTIDASISTVDSATSTVEASTSTVDSATSTVDASTSTVEASTSTVDSATSTVEASTSTVDSATSTVEASTSTAASSTSTTKSSSMTAFDESTTALDSSTSSAQISSTTADGPTSTGNKYVPSNPTLDKNQCEDPKVWRQAFSEHKGTCVCTVNGVRRTVIHPRISNERLLRAFLIGFSISTSGLIFFTVAYFVVKAIKKCAEERKAREAEDYLFDGEGKKRNRLFLLSCFHQGDVYMSKN